MPQKTELRNPNFIQRILMNYTYQGKIKLIALVVASVMIFITYLLISNLRKNIEFIELEVQGNQYQRSVYELLSNIIQHEIKSNENASSNTTKDYKNKIELNFSTLIDYNQEVEKNLKITFKDPKDSQKYLISPQEIFNAWKQSIDSKDTSTNSQNKNYTFIIDSLQNLLTEVGDQSNLTYDPSISTHYLIESTLRTLPEEQDLISRILTLIQNSQNDEQISAKAKFEITTFATLLLSKAYLTKSQIDKSIQGNSKKNLDLETNTLNAQLIDYINTIEIFTKHIQTSILGINTESDVNSFQPYFHSNLKDKTQFSASDLIALGTEAIQKNEILWNSLSKHIENLFKIRIDNIRKQQSIILFIVLLCLAFALSIGYIVISEMNHFFQQVYSAANRFSMGELSARIPVSYDRAFEEIRIIVNELGDRIEGLIDQLQQAGVQLTTTTTEITAAAKHQEGTVCQQEATVKQILLTAGEISSTAKEFAKTMNNVSRSAEETSSLASSGKQSLMQMEDTMRQMVEASKNIASKLAILNEKAGTITSVITTITKVADQTNMLSFNASIEAEKAGEHGKSFGVIATEIRRLADRTANATFDIEKMVSEMMSAVSEGVMGVDKFSEEIRTGVLQVSRVTEQLSSIIAQVQQQTISFEYVNKGMQTQSVGAEQINESIMQLSDAAQETTISIRQFHTAIEQLTIASKEMQSYVTRMKNFRNHVQPNQKGL